MALNLVGQLYRMGAIEPLKPPGAKKAESRQVREGREEGGEAGF